MVDKPQSDNPTKKKDEFSNVIEEMLGLEVEILQARDGILQQVDELN